MGGIGGNIGRINLEGSIVTTNMQASVDSIRQTAWVSDWVVLQPKIGDEYGGGIIAYLGSEGDFINGMVVSSVDTAVAKWGCRGTYIGTSFDMGTGSANTAAIVVGCGDENIAAKVCDNLSLNGYTDWFLPSRDELEEIYDNKSEIDGNFGLGFYWSSSEPFFLGTNAAGVIQFDDGLKAAGDKNNNSTFRAVRGV